MTSVSLQLHDLTPESGHELTPHLVSRPPSPEMGYESLVNESRSGDSISRTATLVCSRLSLLTTVNTYLGYLSKFAASVRVYRYAHR